MNKIIIALFSLCIVISANGKPTSTDKEIMDLSMNYEFDKADKLLKVQFQSGESLKNHFLYLSVELMKILKVEDEVPHSERRATKERMNQKLIDYAEKVIDKYEEDELNIYDRFYLASVHGVLGRLYGVNRSWMSAFSSGKEGRNMMEEIIEENPDFVDAYLLVGMLNYYADRMGGITEFVASILGLSGDRYIGLEYLNKVEKEGAINNWQAAMMLIELYSRLEGNKFESLPLLEKLVNRFPNNKKFVNWLFYEYLNMHQLDKAAEFFTEKNKEFINDYAEALYFHEVGDYKKSNQYYETLLKEKETWSWLYENAKYLRVLNYVFLNDFENAERYSMELSEEYKERFSKLKNEVETFKEIKKFKTAVGLNQTSIINSYIDSNEIFSTSRIASGEYHFYLGVHYFKNGNIEYAEMELIKAIEINPEDLGVKSSRYLINIYKTKTVELDKVEWLLDEIDEYDNDGLEFFAQDLELKYDL